MMTRPRGRTRSHHPQAALGRLHGSSERQDSRHAAWIGPQRDAVKCKL